MNHSHVNPTKRSPESIGVKQCLNGFYSLWCRDFGSVSFLLVALLGIGLAVLAIISKPEQVDVISIALGMCILSISVAIAWQFIKLSANEQGVLIPGYYQRVKQQAALVFIVMMLTCITVLLLSPQPINIGFLLAYLSVGMGFILACLNRPQRFNFSVFVFVILPILPEVIASLPVEVGHFLALLPVVLGALIYRKLQRFSWNPHARSIYLNGLETGWMIGPIAGQNRWFIKLTQFLHPASYFIGPMLGMLLLVLPILSIIAILLSAYFDAEVPVIMVLSQMLIMVCSLIHWTRVQRWRAAETLFMLPTFSGKRGLVDQFFKSQLHLLVIVLSIITVITLVSALFNAQMTLLAGLHIVASTIWASGMALALGAMSRSVLQISLTMLIVIVHSVWLSTSLVDLREQGMITASYYWGDLGLLLLMGLLLVISKHKLWKNGVASL
ncbi:hypothetical protein AN944_01681 [Shewanella sp. P1-14-1]|uniref:hypothetical protein n=1 Tax=Shewanella sp. P1-14-1 TaxID=1723761 RepID=UPI0006D656CE|nr:hypothetical protein [Shewanella sp. P1-14-1]KPZ71306.1 hypothetical protein AN944_01681 [Shewanella sp. P1-14-1]